MKEEKDLQFAHVDDLTKAQVNKICADLLAKGRTHLAKAEKVQNYLEEYGAEDSESSRTAWVKFGDEMRAAEEYAEHESRLRELWASKHPEQPL